jgi:dihydrolipoamide dehydrogenase
MVSTPDSDDGLEVAMPTRDRTMLYAFLEPRHSGFQQLLSDDDSRRDLGMSHVGCGARDAFQYLFHLYEKGLTNDELGGAHELFLNPTHFIQQSQLRAGNKHLRDL